MLKLGMVSSYHPHSMREKSREGHGKNWTHFVYKLDKLFWSIRVSYKNSSVTQGLHFFKLIWTPDFLRVQNAPFKATSSIFNPFTHIACAKKLRGLFFMHLLIILSYKTLKLKSISNELWKGWKLAWFHHFIHIPCARKLSGLRQKLDALHVQNGQFLSKYQDFIRKLVCYNRHFKWTTKRLKVGMVSS